MTDRAACPGTRHGTASAATHDGCRCADAREARSVARKTAQQRQFVNKIPTIRKIQALGLQGWPQEAVAEMAGLYRTHISQILRRSEPRVTLETHVAIDGIFRQLEGVEGPSRQAALTAARRGYLPVQAWKNIDDPDEPQPIVVELFTSRHGIDWYEVNHFAGYGYSDEKICKILGYNLESFKQAKRRRINQAA